METSIATLGGKIFGEQGQYKAMRRHLFFVRCNQINVEHGTFVEQIGDAFVAGV